MTMESKKYIGIAAGIVAFLLVAGLIGYAVTYLSPKTGNTASANPGTSCSPTNSQYQDAYDDAVDDLPQGDEGSTKCWVEGWDAGEAAIAADQSSGQTPTVQPSDSPSASPADMTLSCTVATNGKTPVGTHFGPTPYVTATMNDNISGGFSVTVVDLDSNGNELGTETIDFYESYYMEGQTFYSDPGISDDYANETSCAIASVNVNGGYLTYDNLSPAS